MIDAGGALPGVLSEAPATGERAIPDPVIDEVPLSVYAAVLAYTSEGVSLAASLDHAGLEVDAWPVIEAGFTDFIAESAAEGPMLLEALDAHKHAAHGHVERRLPPLDEDLAAWLDLFRAFAAAADPLGFLAARALTEADIFRLLALWQARTAADRSLGEMASAIFAAPAGPPPEVRPEPPSLRPETKRARVVKPRSKAFSLGATAPMPFDFRSQTLPFLPPDKVPVVLPPPSPKLARRALGETTPVFTPRGAPALPFVSKEAERAAATPASPVVEMPPVPPPPPPYQQPMPPPPPLLHSPPMPPMPPMPPPMMRAARVSLDETAPAAFKALSATLPFVTPTGPSPMSVPSAAEDSAGARKGVSAILRGETAADLPTSPKPALPFTAPQAPVAPPQVPATGSPIRLTLEAYAAMSAELASNPAGMQATLARYGLTTEGKRAEDAAWQARFADDPALRMAWIRELMAAGKRG